MLALITNGSDLAAGTNVEFQSCFSAHRPNQPEGVNHLVQQYQSVTYLRESRKAQRHSGARIPTQHYFCWKHTLTISAYTGRANLAYIDWGDNENQV